MNVYEEAHALSRAIKASFENLCGVLSTVSGATSTPQSRAILVSLERVRLGTKNRLSPPGLPSSVKATNISFDRIISCSIASYSCDVKP